LRVRAGERTRAQLGMQIRATASAGTDRLGQLGPTNIPPGPRAV
jgi:hypothetical protein